MSDIADLVVLTGSPISEPMRVGGNPTAEEASESGPKGHRSFNVAELSLDFGIDAVRL